MSRPTTDEIEKRLREGYYNFDKTEEETISTEKTTRPTTDEIEKRLKEGYYDFGVDSDYINSFTDDSQSYFKNAQKTYADMVVDNASGAAENFWNDGKDLSNRAGNIRAYINSQKDNLDKETYKDLAEYLDIFDSDYRNSWKSIKDKENMLSQYTSQDDYNVALAELLTQQEELKKYQEMAVSEEAKTGWEKYISDLEKGSSAEKDSDSTDFSWEKALMAAGGSSGTGDASGIVANAVNQNIETYRNDDSYKNPTDDWTDEEKNIFGAFYADNPEDAYNYAIKVNDTKSKEKEQKKLQEIQDSSTENIGKGILHAGGSLATSWFGLADYIDNLAENVARGRTTEDGIVSPFEYSQAVRSAQSSKLNEFGTLDDDIPIIGGKGWGDLYDLGMSTVESATSAALLGPGGTAVSYFGQGAASAVDDALARGASSDEALLYGTLVGVAEAGTEYIGADKLLKIGSSNTIKEVLVNVLKQAGAEGLEEGASALLSNFADMLVMQDKSKYLTDVKNLKKQGYSEDEAYAKAAGSMIEDVAYNMLGGAVSGGIHAGGATAIRNAQYNNRVTKNYTGAESQQDLVTEGLELGKGTAANKLANKYQKKLDAGKTLSKGQTRRQIVANEYTLENQDTEKIEKAVVKRFNELGENSQNVNIEKAAKGLVKELKGEELTGREKKALKNSQYADRIRNELSADNIRSGNYSTEWAESIGTNRINSDVYSRLYDLALEKNSAPTEETMAEVTTQSADDLQDDSDIDIQEEKLPSASISASGQTFLAGTKEAVKITDIISDENSKTKLRLDNGREVDVSSIEFTSKDEGLVYEAVANMNLNPEFSKKLIEAYDPGELSANEYITGVKHAYTYGRYNMPTAEMAADTASALLDPVQRNTAYRIGKIANMQRIENDKQGRKEVTSTSTSKGAKSGTVSYMFDETKKKMTDIQKTSVKALKTISEVTGANIVLYDSYVDESGKRVFKDESGNVKEAPNGYYKSSTNTIYLDINAGENAEGTMQFTASHELTHFIRQWSDDKFQVLADFLMEQYGKKGISVNDLIQEQIDKAKRNGTELTYDEAYEEVIADSCQQMLTDGKVLKKLAQKDKTVFDKVKSFIDDLVSKIKSAYSKFKPNSKEANYVAEMVDAVEEIQNLFTEALKDASENYKYSPENIDSNEQKEYNEDSKFSKRNGKSRSNKNSRYDEFNTNVMQWAYSASTNSGDIKVFNRNGKDFALMKATENGAIELKSGKYEVVKRYEQQYREPDNGIYVHTKAMRSYKTRSTTNNITTGNRGKYVRGSGQVGSKGLQGDGTGNNEHLRTGNRGINESDEIKYSQRDPAYREQKEKVNAILEKENAKLREDNEHLKELLKIQGTLTHGQKFTKTSVEAAAGHLMNTAHAKGNKSDLVGLLNNFYGYLASGDKDITWESIKEKAMPAVNWLQDNRYIKPVRTQEAQDILKFIRGCRVYLDEQQQQEVAQQYGSYNDFRKKTMGRIILSNDAKVSLDTQWQELAEMFPQYFDPDISSNDQPSALMEAIDTLQSTEENTAEEYEAFADMAAQQLLTDVYDSYWNVSTLHTVADRKQTEINKLKFKHSQAMSELRDSHKTKEAELKKEQQDRIKKLRQGYNDRLEKQQKKLTEQHNESVRKARERRQKTEMRHRVEKTVRTLNAMLKADNKNKHVTEKLKPAVVSALEMINREPKYIGDTVKRIEELREQLSKEQDTDKQIELNNRIDEMENDIGSLRKSIEELRNAYRGLIDPNSDEHDEIVEMCINVTADNVGSTPLYEMSYEQLEEVYEMYRMVLTRVRDANKAFVAEKKASIESLVFDFMEETEAVRSNKEKITKIEKFVKKYGINNMEPAYLMRLIGSPTLTRLYNNLINGQGIAATDWKEAKEFREQTQERYKFEEWDFKKEYSFTSDDRKELTLTLDEIMTLYAYSKRKQADLHLEKGGISREGDTKKKNKHGIPIPAEYNENHPKKIGKKTLKKITDTLTPAQKNYVDEMQDYLSDVMGKKGNEVSLLLYDVKLFKEKHYFPLKVEKKSVEKGDKKYESKKAKNPGFSKEARSDAENPIILEGFSDVWGRHVEAMSKYHGTVPAIEDFTRVFHNEEVKRRLDDIFGKKLLNNYLSKWIDDINGNIMTDDMSEYFDKGITKFKKAAVLASASVVFQQPAAIARATAYIDLKYFATNPKLIKHKETWAEVQKYAPVAIIKEIGGFDTRTGRSAVDWINGKKSLDDILSKPAAYADEITWCWIWEAVKKEIRTKTNLRPGTEEFFKAAGERFTEVVTLTQVYDSVFAKSAFMRSQNGLAKVATSFMSEPTKSQNMLIDAVIQGKRGNKKFAVRAISGVLMSMILAAVAKSAIYAARDDDEDESYTEKYVGALVGSLLDELNPLSLFPIARDIASLLAGYDIERSDMAVYSDVIDAFLSLSSDTKTTWDKIEDFFGSIGALFGKPVKNILRDGKSIYNIIIGAINNPKTTPEGLKRAIRETITGKEDSKQKRVYDAYLSGDPEEIERANELYDGDQSEVAEKIRSSVKEYYVSGELDRSTAVQYLVEYGGKDYNDANWLIDEWDYLIANGSDDGYSKYNKFYTAVETGQDLRSVINEYTTKGVENKTLASQITSHFKPIYREMSNSERSRLQGYLLNAYEMLGYNRTKKIKDINKWLEE